MDILETLIYMGPNRRTKTAAIEWLLRFSPSEMESLPLAPDLQARFSLAISALGLTLARLEPSPSANASAPGCAAYLVAQATAALQRTAGHLVEIVIVLPANGNDQIRMVCETEEHETGHKALALALKLLQNATPGLEWPEEIEPVMDDLEEAFQEFLDFAEPRAMPPDTLALVAAAKRTGIPVIKLEREPYELVAGDFRIRPNALLMLGRGSKQTILDGMISVDRSPQVLPLANDREGIFRMMHGLGVKHARQDLHSRNCTSLNRARRLARNLGFPVVVKPALKKAGTGVSTAVADESGLEVAFNTALAVAAPVQIEAHVPGRSYRIYFANRKLAGVVEQDENGGRCRQIEAAIHPHTLGQLAAIERTCGTGLLSVTVVSEDISAPLDGINGAIVDVDVAPRMDMLCADAPKLLEHCVDGFLQWLYPAPKDADIPIIAITGTNGKTTTTSMIEHILSESGRRVGMTCTEGIYLNGEKVNADDQAAITGHYKVFESREIDCAVLETARGGIANHGFAYDTCDVAVCTNVSDDHLGLNGVETVAQMAELKRSVVERARQGVVLNADNPSCTAMLPHLNSRQTCLVSMENDIMSLRERWPETTHFCVLEGLTADPSVVVYAGNDREEIAPASQFPATFGGIAKFNLCNAMNAISAALLFGVDSSVITRAITHYRPGYDVLVGRMNFYEGLPFKVLMDYAHNPDGTAQLIDAVRQIPVTGKRIIVFGAAGDRNDAHIAETARPLAKHFDYFLPKNYVGLRGRGRMEVPSLIRDALLEEGVPEAAVKLFDDEIEAIRHGIELSRKGDLLVLLLGHSRMPIAWKMLQEAEAKLK